MVDTNQSSRRNLYPDELVLIPALKVGAWSGGRTNIIPGMIMFSLFGFAGQHIYNTLDARQSSHTSLHQPRSNTNLSPSDVSPISPDASNANQPFWKRALDSRWSPMKVLSDEEYEKMLRQKLLRVEAELAILDEDIAKVQARLEAEKRLEKRERK
ncbi:MAG: hypothetical protein Q9181_006553 [Wetmoreana brouardii]